LLFGIYDVVCDVLDDLMKMIMCVVWWFFCQRYVVYEIF